MSHLGLNILSAIQGMSAIWDVRYWKGFAVITIKKNFLTYTEQQNGPVQLTVKFYTPLVTVDLSPFFLNFKVFSFIMIDFLLQVFFCYFDTTLEVIHFLFQTVDFCIVGGG